ncbi:MAG: hypothetical protein HYX92_15475 [Chloroflexi bacterium]|nr:hypothetical protein [Chloroflexota bacterium]
MFGGFMGKILRVDLTSGKITAQDLPPEAVLRKYIGGFGLGLRFVYDECPPGVAATDPECPLTFFTGPLTGTRMPAATNLTCTTVNFDTGYTIGRSHTHGAFGIMLKRAGYDGLIVTGRAEKPVFLWISEDGVEIRDASSLWGQDSHDTEDLVKEAVRQPRASVAAIGPAGENLCAGAMICNDKNHSMSHSGPGGVMGAKKLKAIAVYGAKRVPVVDKEREKEIARRWIGDYTGGPMTAITIVANGGVGRMDYNQVMSKRFGGICALNLKEASLPGFMEDAKHKVTARPCPGCPVGCSYDVEILSGPHKGYICTLAGGGESVEGSGAMVGLTQSGTVFYLTDLYDRLGIEASTAGCTISMAFEAFERGLITRDDTDGLELKWGDANVVEKVIRKYVSREGFGDVLARGPKAAAEIIGGDAPDFAIHLKGSGMNLHDWRHRWGVFLGQVTGSSAGWTTPGADQRPDADAGFPEKQEPCVPEGKPQAARGTNVHKQINDSIGVCWFLTWARPGGIKESADAISAVTGWDYSLEEIREAGERIAHLERAFNIRRGLKPEDDYTVPPRMLEPPEDGAGKGKSIGPYLKGMINEYYRLMGWDEKTGKPWRSTLNRLGLEDVAKDLWD